MKKRHLIISITIFVLVALSATFLTFAYFYDKYQKKIEENIGLVKVSSDIYFDNNGNRETPTEVITSEGFKKNKVYEVNVSDLNSLYHINKLRVNFKVQSNVETYFRIRLVDTLTLRIPLDNGGYRELSVPNEGIEYNIASGWYIDHNTNWYYYKLRVKKEVTELEIPFIIEGLSYDLRAPQYRIQLGIKVESVQALNGPLMNWGLTNPPWDIEGGSW